MLKTLYVYLITKRHQFRFDFFYLVDKIITTNPNFRFSGKYYGEQVHTYNGRSSVPSTALDFLQFKKSKKQLDWDSNIFLDVGSGNGKVLYFSQQISEYKRILGVEVDSRLALESAVNLDKFSDSRIKIHRLSVLDFKIPNEAIDIFYYNSLSYEDLFHFLEHNLNSLQRFGCLFFSVNDQYP